MKRLFDRRFSLWMLLAVGSVLVAEVVVRALGLVDFPLYDANAQIGYIPSANQQGSFRNRNHWQFNAQHMEAPPFAPSADLDVLLIGDSLVYGGNTYRQSERLGPSLQVLLQQHAGGRVWPIGAGSWSLPNELTWLGQNADIVRQIDRIVFVLNSSDFDKASSWSCELTHPRARPLIATWYLFNKYIHSFEGCGTVPSSLQVPPGDVEQQLRSFVAGHGSKTSFILYPSRDELLDPALRAENFLKGSRLLSAAGASQVIHVAQQNEWRVRLYKDTVHPTAEGNRVLSGIIFRALERPPATTGSPGQS